MHELKRSRLSEKFKGQGALLHLTRFLGVVIGNAIKKEREIREDFSHGYHFAVTVPTRSKPVISSSLCTTTVKVFSPWKKVAEGVEAVTVKG
jgi:hypothetical protein